MDQVVQKLLGISLIFFVAGNLLEIGRTLDVTAPRGSKRGA